MLSATGMAAACEAAAESAGRGAGGGEERAGHGEAESWPNEREPNVNSMRPEPAAPENPPPPLPADPKPAARDARACSRRGERLTTRSASGLRTGCRLACGAGRRGEMRGGELRCGELRCASVMVETARAGMGDAVGVGWRKARTSASEELAMKREVGDGAISRDVGM